MLNKDKKTPLEAELMDLQLLDTLTMKVSPRHDQIGTGSHLLTTQVCATISAKDLPDDENQRAPVDIMVVLDVSGSMNRYKLDQCKTSLELLLRQLLPDDRFGLVSFAEDAEMEIPVAKASAHHKRKSLQMIRALETRGMTNISAAIGLAAQEMREIVNPNEVRTVFLLTDGEANMGITDQAGLVDLTKNCLLAGIPISKDESTVVNASIGDCNAGIDICSMHAQFEVATATQKTNAYVGPPITLHCFGYGTDHDSTMLQEISKATQGGTYYFVENDSNVATAFGDALGGVLSIVAQSAVARIAVPEEAKELGVQIVDVYHDKKVKRDDGSYTVSLGDFYAEETRDIMFEVKLANPVNIDIVGGNLISHVSVTLSYTDTVLKGPATQGPVFCGIARPVGLEVSKENQHVVVQWLRVYAARELGTVDELSKTGNLARARSTIQNAMNEIHSVASMQSDLLVQQLIADLNDVKSGLSSKEKYESYGRHHIQNRHQTHTMQRAMDSTPMVTNVYSGKRKSAMANRFTSST